MDFDIEVIYTNEFLDYKEGFVNGKYDLINELLNDIKLREFNEDYFYGANWYSLGYNDGFNYYKNVLKTLRMISYDELLGRLSWSILNEAFIQRARQINMICEPKLPAFTLKLTPNLGDNYEEM